MYRLVKALLTRTQEAYSIVDEEDHEIKVLGYYRRSSIQEVMYSVNLMLMKKDKFEHTDSPAGKILRVHAHFDTPEELVFDCPELLV